ncbi:hypothetical protein GCM10008967_37100 [Bacillus carboniphilus]|uniref:Uncharacterized protein n=1 Tax=Bacillus carboniphilus TaxID=86663 RepID=A0ABN0WPP9_9BACI
MKVNSLAKFEQLKTQGQGYFVISDIANPTKVHHVKCSFVTAQNFKTKVIDNSGKNGDYMYYSSIEATNDQIHKCGHCFR